MIMMKKLGETKEEVFHFKPGLGKSLCKVNTTLTRKFGIKQISKGMYNQICIIFVYNHKKTENM